MDKFYLVKSKGTVGYDLLSEDEYKNELKDFFKRAKEKRGCVVCYDSNEEVFLGRDYGHSKNVSEKVAAEIDGEVEKILNTQYEKAKKLLSEKSDMLDAAAKLLLEKETIGEDEFEEFFK